MTSKSPLRELVSSDGEWKAEIWERADGTLQVRLFRWTDEDVPDYGRVASFWEEIGEHVSITDSLDIAMKIASELLHRHDAGNDA
jgi:hypothetical protein